MKSFFTTACLALMCGPVYSQNIGINVDGSAPNASALLDIDGSGLPANAKRGVLFPRVSLVATNVAAPIVSPAVSLVVYNNATAGTTPNDVIPGFYYWDGVAWKSFCEIVAPVCPAGFVRIPGQTYCIEINERPLCDWDAAETTCRSLGYRLCDFSEWRTACFNQASTVDNIGSVVPLQNMVGNYEWTSFVSGNGDGTVAGSGSCTDVGGISIYTVSPRFRCCVSP